MASLQAAVTATKKQQQQKTIGTTTVAIKTTPETATAETTKQKRQE